MGLEDFDDKVETIKPGGKVGLKDLPDGDYDFVIEKAEQSDTKAGTLLRMKLSVETEGMCQGKEVEHVYFMTTLDKSTQRPALNEVGMSILKKDLATLGFDEPEWKKATGRPFSSELRKAIFAMSGMKFKGKKSTNGNYANLFVNERLEDGKPKQFGSKELDAVASNPDGEPWL